MTARWTAKQFKAVQRLDRSTSIPEIFDAIVMSRYLRDPQNPKRQMIRDFAGDKSLSRLALAILWHESTLATADLHSKFVCQEVIIEELLKMGIPESLVVTDDLLFC